MRLACTKRSNVSAIRWCFSGPVAPALLVRAEQDDGAEEAVLQRKLNQGLSGALDTASPLICGRTAKHITSSQSTQPATLVNQSDPMALIKSKMKSNHELFRRHVVPLFWRRLRCGKIHLGRSAAHFKFSLRHAQVTIYNETCTALHASPDRKWAHMDQLCRIHVQIYFFCAAMASFFSIMMNGQIESGWVRW